MTSGVVVTGGGSGIGRACVRALAEVGRPVAAWDLDGDAAVAAIERLDVPAIGISVDVADPDAVEAAVERTRAALPLVGGLVHAAGIVAIEPIGDVDFANFQRVLDVNLVAFARISQLLLADLRAAGEGAAIVGIASIDAIVGSAVIPAYCSSKAGMLGLVRSMAATLGPEGIRVNAVCPGYIDTPMLAPGLVFPEVRESFESAAALRRIGQPEDIAGVVRFLLSADAGFITGQAIVADGGVLAVH
ncbi:MAG TPA: SDR family oxidoreductase [Microthrixaceae bacterium]|nr:SDR family oxidoreductase [Microthrixaceae bacterium]